MTSRRVLVIGGSTRAAADSIRRAGWEPVCADLFADLDLRANAEVIPVRSYPDSLPEDIAEVRAAGWFYCGALENHPEIIERILAKNIFVGPLLGSTHAALKLVRSPYWVSNTLRWEGIDVLDVANQNAVPPPDGTWLQKPLNGAGGRLIRVWDEAATADPFSEPHYFQKIAPGIGMSALFRLDAGDVTWLGASRELASPPESDSPTRFTYCGSIGPLSETEDSQGSAETISAGTKATLTKIAQVLARQSRGLRGLIGLDFRLDGDSIWLTEVNPRYTASVEVLELATGRSLLSQKSDRDQSPSSDSVAAVPRKVVVKQILYATRPLTAPDLGHAVGNGDPWQIHRMADIPVPGIVIEPGWPICSVLASGATHDAALAALKCRLNEVQDLLQTPR